MTSVSRPSGSQTGTHRTLARRFRAAALGAFAASAFCACVTPRPSFSPHTLSSVRVAGVPDARQWVDTRGNGAVRPPVGPAVGADGSFDILALSGGGPDGAFGAGLLAGWSQTGARPEFDVVTGVSSGALMAPMAFVGKQEDSSLRRFFTGDELNSITGAPQLLGLVIGRSVFAADRLASLVEAAVDDELLADIAVQDRGGRRLYVLTASLDAQRMVAWDMGVIAAAATRDRQFKRLFHRIMIAAASIPGAFPPVEIESLGADGLSLAEAHVDAGIIEQIFIPTELLAQARPGLPRRVYAIVNNHYLPNFRVMPLRGVNVATRALSTLIKANTRLTIDAAREEATIGHAEFHLAYLDPSWPVVGSLDFDQQYMEELYAKAFRRAADGVIWQSASEPVSGPPSSRVGASTGPGGR